ncbi:hypothetical protein FAES_2286 [Fibrella aestuarina BUZ 2]|uniref:Uncharacterized protein n=1 Tax=Fibrella aestuarina BUZ 2 TaxID=1166018 RepID=I0K842_9BACT|nr:hypothetical protein [Fibrella aestuarina]CCH00295.1 hypothetical protein FAES_2286 [Fibrella aestuarina BUZ 2]
MSVDVSRLAAKLKENVADYSKIFRLNQSNGFNIKQDRLFTPYQIRDKVPLIRSSTTSMLQPGRKGGTPNFKGGVELAGREGMLRPFQANLKLDEQTLYAWTKTYLAKKKPTDSSDIYSFEAMNWYMENVMAQCRKDALGFVYKGVYNATGTNAIDIMDGLKLKFTQGIATTGTGWVGDIPVANIVTSAATINASNVLTELQKLGLLFFGAMDEPLEEEVIIAVDPMHIVYITQALDSQLSNNQQIVYRENGKLRLAFLPKSSIEPRTWLKGTDKQLLTLPGNLAVMGPEDTTEDIPSIQIESADRNLKLFLDGELGIDYADGRVLFMNDK